VPDVPIGPHGAEGLGCGTRIDNSRNLRGQQPSSQAIGIRPRQPGSHGENANDDEDRHGISPQPG
jgi:hypothetical protein